MKSLVMFLILYLSFAVSALPLITSPHEASSQVSKLQSRQPGFASHLISPVLVGTSVGSGGDGSDVEVVEVAKKARSPSELNARQGIVGDTVRVVDNAGGQLDGFVTSATVAIARRSRI